MDNHLDQFDETMTLEEYIESFGWTIEDCTPEELEEVKKELEEVNNGAEILDGVLALRIPHIHSKAKPER